MMSRKVSHWYLECHDGSMRQMYVTSGYINWSFMLWMTSNGVHKAKICNIEILGSWWKRTTKIMIIYKVIGDDILVMK